MALWTLQLTVLVLWMFVYVRFLWPETLRLTVLVLWMTVYVPFSGLRLRYVQSHSDGSHAEANSLCPARALA